MNSSQQISRGLERLMCRAEGARLEGMFGLAGMGDIDNFRDFAALAGEAGLSGVDSHVKQLRAKHARKCARMEKALPVALAVKSVLEEVMGDDPASLDEQLGAITVAKAQKQIAKAQKSAAKVAAKEAKHDAKIAAKVAKLEAKGAAAKVAKVQAKEAKHDAKIAAKNVKLSTKIDTAQKAITALTQPAPPVVPVTPATATEPAAGPTPPPLTPSTVTTPLETAAAVLAQQAGVTANTPAAQAFTQEVVANAANPGSTIPQQSLFSQGPSAPSYGGSDAAPSAESSGGFFDNVSPLMLAGGAVGVFVLVKAMSGSKRA
jgi:hypothetical protein